MKNKKLIAGISTVFIVILGLFIAPLFLGRTINETREAAVTDESPSTSIEGQFEGVGIHLASGTATLITQNDKQILRLEDNFSVTNGPDLYVAFGKDGEYREEGLIEPLKGNKGGQNYEIPETIDASQYNEVWVWCKQFGVGFAKAPLK